VKQEGAPGFDIVVTRIIRKDGEETSQRFFTRYKPQPKIIEHGPGSPSPSTSPGASPAPGSSGAPRQTSRPPATPPAVPD
jgi:hypothetical protein